MYNTVYHQLSCARNDGVKARIRLVLFGFAGGRIAALMSLAKELPSWIEVWGAEYPGRGFRWKTHSLNSAQHLLDDLMPGLRGLCNKPVVLLGYSMGANIAYRLGLNLSGQVLGVIAASAPPPSQKVMDLHKYSDQRLLEHLESLGGIPPEILSSQAIMDIFLPVVRADLECCSDMDRLALQPLNCPILVMHGSADRMVRITEAPRWLQISGGRTDFSLCKVYPGGHFFHQGVEAKVALDITNWLLKLLSTTVPASEPAPSSSKNI